MSAKIEIPYMTNLNKMKEIYENKIIKLDRTNFKFMLESKIDSKNKFTFFIESREIRSDEEVEVRIRCFLNGMFFRGFNAHYLCRDREDSDEYNYSSRKLGRKWYHQVDSDHERGDIIC